jgi:hypothetical protein
MPASSFKVSPIVLAAFRRSSSSLNTVTGRAALEVVCVSGVLMTIVSSFWGCSSSALAVTLTAPAEMKKKGDFFLHCC